MAAAKSRRKIANVNEPFISAGHAPVFARSHQRISRGQEMKKKTFFFFAFCKKILFVILFYNCDTEYILTTLMHVF
jgi:hypothetical protein